MKALIPISYYTNQSVFDKEQQLYATQWRVVGLVSDAPQPDDYFTTTVGGRSVIVQNFDGELRAFANVCSYRGLRGME